MPEPPQFLASALHVAGHAVLSFLFHLPFDTLVLGVSSADGAVYAEVERTPKQQRALHEAPRESVLVMLQGGLAAETIAVSRDLLRKADVAQQAGYADAYAALAWLPGAAREPVAPALPTPAEVAVLDPYVERAQDTLARRWSTVVALAEALEARGALEWPRVRRLLERSIKR